MTQPNDVVARCDLCAETSDEWRPVRTLDECGRLLCLPCLVSIVRTGSTPTVEPVLGVGLGYELGRLPPEIRCPFCRRALTREVLDASQVPPNDIEAAFAVDRTRWYVRYESDGPWEIQDESGDESEDDENDDDNGITALFSRLPRIDNGELPALAGADGVRLIVEADTRLVVSLRTYQGLVADMVNSLAEMPVGSEETWAARFVPDVEQVTREVFQLCRHRAEVLFLLPSPDDLIGAANAFVDMRGACEAVLRNGDDVLSSWETLMQTPCAVLPVHDLSPLSAVLGSDTSWFALASEIDNANKALKSVWRITTKPFGPDADSVDERRRRADGAATRIAQTEFGECARKLHQVLKHAETVSRENNYLNEQMATARQLFGLPALG
ncbi:hypothetical protein [Lentzea sp. E54]|uniref:hypothetical protein n=1 Tax=Lentzea xerophila TaxID=3435883 RepID=UPI003DA54F35